VVCVEQGGRAKVAKQRKAAKKAVVKKKSVSKPKPKTARAKSGGEEREVHYSDLRKVMLASVLKRLT
jgi:hypothetical protein